MQAHVHSRSLSDELDSPGLQEICLHAVVAMQMDSTMLLTVLQTLMPEQALLLARYLLKWLAFHEGEHCSYGRLHLV